MKAASAYFADVLERVSRVAASGGQREVIWIDGLDEAFGPTGRYHDEPGLPGLLPAHLPPGIFAVLTSRPGDHLHWLRNPQLCTRHRIEDERQQNIEDVLAYLASQALTVTPPPTDDFIKRAAERTKGNFHIAVHKMEEIKRDPAAPQDPETIPESVYEYHGEVYGRVVSRAQREGIREKDVRFVLGLTAQAREPLTPEQLGAFNAPEFTEQVLAWAADYFRQRPLHRAPDLHYEFNHTSVPECLTEQLMTKERQEIHARIADGCLNWRDLSEAARLYALRHLPAHLREAGEFERLATILTYYPFLQAKLDYCGVFDLLADCRESLAAWPPEERLTARREWVEAVFRIMDRDSHLLKERPRDIYQTVFNTLSVENSGLLNRWASFSAKYLWLRWVNPRRAVFSSPLVRTLYGHSDPVNSVAFSPDGKRVVSGSDDHTLRIWDAETGELVALFECEFPVRDCRWNVQGDEVRAADDDGLTYRPNICILQLVEPGK